MSGVVLQSAGYQRCNTQSNICYEFHNQPVKHSDADASCLAHHGQLATILNNQTQQDIQDILHNHCWIGGKLNIEDQWTWVNGMIYSGTFDISSCVVLSRITVDLHDI